MSVDRTALTSRVLFREGGFEFVFTDNWNRRGTGLKVSLCWSVFDSTRSLISRDDADTSLIWKVAYLITVVFRSGTYNCSLSLLLL